MITDMRGERLDLKKLWTQFIHKIWIVIAATIVGAIIGVLAYVIYSNVMSGNTVYQIRNDYYVYLDYEGYPNGPDYYNAYTWDCILRDDPVVNYALEIEPSITKDELLNSVSGEILGDYRILTVVVKGTDKDKVQTISDTYKLALPHFATVVDMIDHIDVWTDAEIEEFDEYTREGNAAFLGGLIAFLFSLFAILIGCAIDDGIYTERDWLTRYGDIQFLGLAGSEEHKLNAEYILGEKEALTRVRVENFIFTKESFEAMRKEEGIVLQINRGKDKGEAIDKVVYTLIKQDVVIKAVELI